MLNMPHTSLTPFSKEAAEEEEEAGLVVVEGAGEEVVVVVVVVVVAVVVVEDLLDRTTLLQVKETGTVQTQGQSVSNSLVCGGKGADVPQTLCNYIVLFYTMM